jgi:hypothetical protein
MFPGYFMRRNIKFVTIKILNSRAENVCCKTWRTLGKRERKRKKEGI